MKIKRMPHEQRPREKAMDYGVGSLSDRELLALFIRTGTKNHSVLEIADEVLMMVGGFSGFLQVNQSELMQVEGIKHVKSLELIALVEAARRMMIPQKGATYYMHEPQSIHRWLNLEIGSKEQEHFFVIFLNQQNQIIHYQSLFIGTVNQSLIHPREVIKEALIWGSVKLILVHNHPSGHLEPSAQDWEATRVMVEAARAVGLQVLDHLIVSKFETVSLRSIHGSLFE